MRRRLTTPQPARRTWASSTFYEKMCFTIGHGAPSDTRAHIPQQFTGWADFLAAHESVRDELLAARPTLRHLCFGERVYQYTQRHGVVALETAAYGDIHDDGGR